MWPTNCFNELFQKVFGKDNIPHAEIAKELKEQNEDTYRMMVWYSSISLEHWFCYNCSDLAITAALIVFILSSNLMQCRCRIQWEKTLLNWRRILQTSNRRWWYVIMCMATIIIDSSHSVCNSDLALVKSTGFSLSAFKPSKYWLQYYKYSGQWNSMWHWFCTSSLSAVGT